MKKINITDKEGKSVYVGDKFWAYIVSPTLSKPTEVTVISDTTEENLSFNRDYEVEDNEGNKLWNAYMVIKNRDRVKKGENVNKYHANKVAEWSKEYDFKSNTWKSNI